MRRWLSSLWRRFSLWLALRLGRLRGRWHVFELEATVARWTWFPAFWQRHAWRYAVYEPGSLRADEIAPLLVLLHGCGQQAMPFAQAAGWVRAAERERFRLLCPQQRRGANVYGCWNWFHPPAQAGHGELDVITGALDQVQARWPCGAVAAVGLSAGGGMAALLAFHAADRFAAVVAVAAPPLLGRANLQDPRQVMRHGLAISPGIASFGQRGCAPLLVLHGADDETVAPLCAEQLAAQAREAMARGGEALVERPQPDGQRFDDVAGRIRLQRRLLPGLAHAWSGALGGHAHVQREGPALTSIALAFLREAGWFVSSSPPAAAPAPRAPSPAPPGSRPP